MKCKNTRSSGKTLGVAPLLMSAALPVCGGKLQNLRANCSTV